MQSEDRWAYLLSSRDEHAMTDKNLPVSEWVACACVCMCVCVCVCVCSWMGYAYVLFDVFACVMDGFVKF